MIATFPRPRGEPSPVIHHNESLHARQQRLICEILSYR